MSDAKLEVKPIRCFNNEKNLVNFDQNTQNPQNFNFGWFFLGKVYNL